MIPTSDPDAPWLAYARGCLGYSEIERGKLSNFVRALFTSTRFPLAQVTIRTPWCAAFACTALEQSGVTSPRTARARDFLRWGVPLAFAVRGAVLVFSRGPKGGHVAFALDEPHGGLIDCLGGNQKNRVTIDRRRTADVIGIRWPTDVPLPPGAIRA